LPRKKELYLRRETFRLSERGSGKAGPRPNPGNPDTKK